MNGASESLTSYISPPLQCSKPSTEIGSTPSAIADNDVHYPMRPLKTLLQLTVSSTRYRL